MTMRESEIRWTVFRGVIAVKKLDNGKWKCMCWKCYADMEIDEDTLLKSKVRLCDKCNEIPSKTTDFRG